MLDNALSFPLAGVVFKVFMGKQLNHITIIIWWASVFCYFFIHVVEVSCLIAWSFQETRIRFHVNFFFNWDSLHARLNSHRGSHRRYSIKKGVLRNFTKCTGKHLCQSFFFNKVTGLSPESCSFIKKETLTKVFSCEFCETSQNTFFTEPLWTTASAATTRHGVTRKRRRKLKQHLNKIKSKQESCSERT